MTLRFLLDTNVLSEPLRLKPNPQVAARIGEFLQAFAVPAPAWHELLFGVKRLPPSTRQELMALYLLRVLGPHVPILPYGKEAATWHATERARLTGIGKTPPYLDGQIAAIAKVNGLILVTANQADFSGFSGLEIEDWSR